MERREALALIFTALILIGLPAAVLGYQYGLRPALAPTRIIDIRAAVPGAGGFQPDSIRVKAGEKVTLRFTSVDVTHGVAIGPGLGIDLGHVDPGEVKEITLTFERAGTYTFYCNSWCSPDHWRMRGVIEIIDAAHPNSLPTPQRDPVIEALIAEGVNIDDNVHSADATPEHTATPGIVLERRPSAERGAAILGRLAVPPELQDPAWSRSHTPAQALDLLAAQNPQAARADLVDAVAALWTGDLAPSGTASTLYNKNCAACHGPTGAGDGPAADTAAQNPVNFADPAYMFTRRSDVLYAKIRRGGMGTDMPNFGTLFTSEETWAVVEYLWTFSLVQGETGR